MVHAPRYADWIMSHFTPYLRGNIIEIGAGIGTMSERIRHHAKCLDLLEPSANCADLLRERFGHDEGIRLFNEMAEIHFRHRQGYIYDSAVMINVLEHIEDDRAILSDIRPHLRNDGNLLIYVPAMPALYGAFDRSVGHFRRYTPRHLRRVLDESGYRIVVLKYIDMLGVAPWYLINTLLGAKTINPAMASVYDMIGVPFTRFVESAIDAPFGKNLIVVAAKN